jgi:hypothetical protein
MKRIFYLCSLVIFLGACGTNKNYLERSDEDKALQDAVKKLNKNPADEKALEAIPVLYTNIQQTHLGRIKSYSTARDAGRWDKVINEYQHLQEAYDALINSTPAFKLVNPKSYSTELFEAKQSAAEEYYLLAAASLAKPGRDNAKKAYTYFKKSDNYVSGYKDASAKMEEAYANAVVNVVINPVQDNSFFFNSGWGNTGYNYSNEFFQQTLVRELANSGNRYAAKFYTDWEARRDNIQPDWVIDLRLRNMDLPQPTNYSYRRNASAQIETGRDTTGKPVYRTVYATVNVTRISFTARADMEVAIKDVVSGKNISFNSYRDDYRWEEERATYTGDSRALSGRDWDMINNNGFYNQPRKEDVLSELYRKLYPQVKNNISYAVEW